MPRLLLLLRGARPAAQTQTAGSAGHWQGVHMHRITGEECYHAKSLVYR